jgi:hypothetical protein
MKWAEVLQTVVEHAGSIERIPEKEATKVARLFYDQEVYPRMQALRARLDRTSYEVLLWPSTPPPEGMTWRVETVKLSVYHPAQQSEMLGPLATISFEYRIALLWDGSMYTKEGRSNSVVFTLLGEPIRHVELWIESFLENLGVVS